MHIITMYVRLRHMHERFGLSQTISARAGEEHISKSPPRGSAATSKWEGEPFQAVSGPTWPRRSATTTGHLLDGRLILLYVAHAYEFQFDAVGQTIKRVQMILRTFPGHTLGPAPKVKKAASS